jgi:MinD superfamily P-loop ATPase
VVADCDVDAADLHLVLKPTLLERTPFFAGHQAQVLAEKCSGCGLCVSSCRAEAFAARNRSVVVEPLRCEGCGLCVRLCPEDAIAFPERRCGEWYLSETRVGPMVHARLEPGGESSGKLVTLVRREAQRLAKEGAHDLIVVDGPPGIGCPVIATLSGATELLAVTEPTPAGLHDLERLLDLADHFQVPAMVCVASTTSASTSARRPSAWLARGRRSSAGFPRPAVTAAQVAGRSVVEEGGRAHRDRRAVENLERRGELHVIRDELVQITDASAEPAVTGSPPPGEQAEGRRG